MTVIPFFVAASKSMLSTPVPALPTTFNDGALLMTSLVTFVSDRTINPSCSYTVLTLLNFRLFSFGIKIGREGGNRRAI